jgi:hypothetical protein
MMRPELDTKNPPGQQTHVPKEHQQLSDYIRSINRREALDTVAAEKKTTFDKWFAEYTKQHGLPPAYVVAEAAWNAALRCGKASQEHSE